MRRPRPERIPSYFQHMIEAIDRIQSYVAGIDLIDFRQNLMVQDAVIKNFEVLGEASNRILFSDPEFEASHPRISLHVAYGMRNALAHGYDAVNLDVLWGAIQNHLPLLKTAILAYQNQSE